MDFHYYLVFHNKKKIIQYLKINEETPEALKMVNSY